MVIKGFIFKEKVENGSQDNRDRPEMFDFIFSPWDIGRNPREIIYIVDKAIVNQGWIIIKEETIGETIGVENKTEHK